MKKIKSILTIMTVTALIHTVAPAGTTTLIMLPVAEARGPQVLLRELVRNHEALPGEWGNRAVISAPEPGRVKNVTISTIAYALQQYPDMNSVTLRGTQNTTVRRTAASLDAERIERAIREYIARQEEWENDQIQVVFDNLTEIKNLPEGKLGIRIDNHNPQPGGSGNYIFDFTITSDNLPARRESINAKVFVMRDMWVAAQPLRRGHILTFNDLESRSLPWHPASRGVPDEENITGLELSRSLKAGQPIYRQLLMEPICARSGDQINVSAHQGGLTVTMRARALATGRRGDRIMCMNETSRRRMLVRLTAPRTAEVEIPSLSKKE